MQEEAGRKRTVLEVNPNLRKFEKIFFWDESKLKNVVYYRIDSELRYNAVKYILDNSIQCYNSLTRVRRASEVLGRW